MNLTTLRATIRAYSENDFPNTVGSGGLTSDQQVDTFITQAEERIFNSVQFPNFRKNVTGTGSASNKYLGTPGDFLAVYSLAVVNPTTGEYEFLLNKDVNYIRAAYPVPTTTGSPKYYALFDDNTFILAPTPASNYTFELHYFYYPESITTASGGETWLGNNFDMALLYGALCEAAVFMKAEPDVIANYSKRYEEAMILAKRMGDGMERRDAYRSGQVRLTVN